MKIELKKMIGIDGGMFYQVFQDGNILKSFWIGNHITNEVAVYGKDATGDEAALAKAKEYYDFVKANATSEPIVSVIQSETI